MGRGEVRFGFGTAVVVMGVAGLVGGKLVGRRTVLERRGNFVGVLSGRALLGAGLVLVLIWDLVEDGEESGSFEEV